MRDIALVEPPDQFPVFTMLAHGDTRTGKTRWGATCPRPLIIADVAEGGYQTVQRMNPAAFFEPDVPPVIWGIESMNDMFQIRERVKPLIAAGRIKTIVVDAFSFYIDLYLSFLTNIQTAGGKAVDPRRLYGDLGVHLRELRVATHGLGASVVWNTLCKHPDEDDPKGRPLIPGKQGDKFAAGVDYLVHTRVNTKQVNGKTEVVAHEMRTRQWGAYICGNRLGEQADNLPDPLIGDYSTFITALGYDPAALRKLLPKPIAIPRIGGGPAAPATPPAAKAATTPKVFPVVTQVTKPTVTSAVKQR